MRRKISKGVFVALFVAVISFCAVISSSAGAKDSSEQEGLVIPPNKCVFIDTHTATKGIGDVGPQLMIDFPTYSFYGNGELRSWIKVPGFGENTKVLVGRGRSLSGTAGGGASTMLSAYDADNVENLFYFDADATVHYYYKGDWRTVKVGETWTETVLRDPSTGDGKLIDTNTIKNCGFVDRIDIIIPTPEATPTPSATSAATSTATPTLPVATHKVYNISGYIKPSFSATDKNCNSGFTVEVIGMNKSAATDENGFFEIDGVPVNDEGYTLKISKEYYLPRTIEFHSRGEDIQIGRQTLPVSMWVGDIVIDNAINISDILEIAKSFNSFSYDPKYNKNVDINKDGAVNIQDIMIVAVNFNKVSSSYDNNDIKVLHKIKLQIGDTTRMALKESGAAGIRWDYEIENENIIKFENDAIEEKIAGDPFVTHFWEFKAIADGMSYLTFKSTTGEEELFLVIVGNNSVTATPTPLPTPSPDSHTINLKVGEITEISQYDCAFIDQEWDYYITDTRILTLNSEFIERELVPDDYCKHTWRFKAESPGTTYITFRSTNGRAERFTVIVSKSTVTTPEPSPGTIQEISLRERDQVGIVLEEGGFAGITWKYEINDNNIIRFSSEKIESPQTYYTDALYRHSWRFKAFYEGTTTITFKSSIGQTKSFLIKVSK